MSHDTATWGVGLTNGFVAVLRRIIVQMTGKFVGPPASIAILQKIATTGHISSSIYGSLVVVCSPYFWSLGWCGFCIISSSAIFPVFPVLLNPLAVGGAFGRVIGVNRYICLYSMVR